MLADIIVLGLVLLGGYAWGRRDGHDIEFGRTSSSNADGNSIGDRMRRRREAESHDNKSS